MLPEIPRELALHPGPVASLYLDVSRDHPGAQDEIRLRAQALARTLAEQGADEQTVRVAYDAAVEPHSLPGPAGRAVFAADGEVLHRADLPAPPRHEMARWSLLPHLFPLLAQAPPAREPAQERAATEELLTDYEVESGEGTGLAVDGLAEVVHALQRNQAGTVFVRDDPSSDLSVWVGAAPAELALDPHELEEQGARVLGTDRADAALVRAVAGSGADLVVLPHPAADSDPRRSGSAAGAERAHEQDLPQPELTGGVGALLRFASG